MIEGGIARGGYGAEGFASIERIGPGKAGLGGASLDPDHGFSRVDRGEAVDAQRGEREPAVATNEQRAGRDPATS